MAIYHLSTQSISRSQGRSVVACAAYRAAEKLQDVYYDQVYDYSRKQNVVYKEILTPEIAPWWMKNREVLWSYVEAIEKRKDARLAREIQFSLPRELTVEQNKVLAQEFVQQTFVNEGMVADLCIHVDKAADNQEQPHCHVLLTTRNIDEAGLGLKNPQWNKKEMLLKWREDWANIANQHLALHGFDIKIDHRNYIDQKIKLEPQYKIGIAKTKQQQQRLVDHQRIAQENGERIYNNPSIALDALIRQQSTFTHQDLARFIHRHTNSTEQFHKVYERVKADPELVHLGEDKQLRERLTAKQMLLIETNMLKNAHVLSERDVCNVNKHTLETIIAKRLLSEEQETALRYITDVGDLKCVLGYAGTGKSYLLDAAREVWQSSGYRVRGVALSSIATQNLQQGSSIKSRTTASLFHSWDKDQSKLNNQDILVIDEAGMLGSRQMERIITQAQDKGAKVVMLGDWQQLQAIEAGAAFRSIAEGHQYIELKEVRRQSISWQRDATVCLAKGQVEAALSKYQEHDHLHSFDTQTQAKEHLIKQWNDVRHTHPQESQLIMAYTRKDVRDINELARQLKQRDAELGQNHTFDMNTGSKEFATGDRVYFLKRDDSLGVINGTLGTIKAIESKTSQIHIELDQDQLSSRSEQVTVDTRQYNHLDHGYAATVYKAQGTTVDRSYLLASKHYDAHSTYVGMSRHKLSCDVFSSREQFKDERELTNTLSRNRIKDVTLDYTKPWLEYAHQREIQLNPRLDPLLILHSCFEQNSSFYENQTKLIIDAKDKQERQHFWRETDKFTTKLEQAHPEASKRIFDSLMPEHEKQASEYIKQFKAYNRDISKLEPKDRLDFANLTQKMMSSTAIMNHISSRDQELANQIKETFKQHELKHSRSREYSFSL